LFRGWRMQVSIPRVGRWLLAGMVMIASSVNAVAAEQADMLPVSEEMKAVATANQHFAVDLYKHLARVNADQNGFVSPFSISMPLTMGAQGADDETFRQMSNTLHLPATDMPAIHRGQVGILARVTPSIPKEVIAEISKLRNDLKAANDQTNAFINDGKIL